MVGPGGRVSAFKWFILKDRVSAHICVATGHLQVAGSESITLQRFDLFLSFLTFFQRDLVFTLIDGHRRRRRGGGSVVKRRKSKPNAEQVTDEGPAAAVSVRDVSVRAGVGKNVLFCIKTTVLRDGNASGVFCGLF